MTTKVTELDVDSGNMEKLTPREEKFCQEYVFSLNASKAAIKAGYSEKTASAAGSRLLRNVKIRERIEFLKQNLSETAEISSLRVLREHEKIAFADAGQLRDGWLNLKEFKQLTPEQKSIIQEITTKETKFGTEYKIRLYDKQKSLDSISTMLGFNAPEKTEVTGKDGAELFQGIVIQKTYEGKEDKGTLGTNGTNGTFEIE